MCENNEQVVYNELNRRLEIDAPFDDFVCFDDDLPVCGKISDADIIAVAIESASGNFEQSDDDNEIVNVKTSTSSEVRQAINCLKSFFEMSDCTGTNIFKEIINSKNFADKIISKNMRQKKITDFFVRP